MASFKRIKIIKIGIVAAGSIILFALVSGCVSTTSPPEKTRYTDVSVLQGKDMIDRGEVFILDVRTREEYDAGHIRGSALIPLQELDKRLNEIPKDKKILVYCRTGHRSTQASEILANNGFKEVYNMKSGITEWTNSGYEIEK